MSMAGFMELGIGQGLHCSHPAVALRLPWGRGGRGLVCSASMRTTSFERYSSLWGGGT